MREKLATQERHQKKRDEQWHQKCEKIKEHWKEKSESSIKEMQEAVEAVNSSSWKKQFDESDASRLALSAEIDMVKALDEQRKLEWGAREREYESVVRELEELRAVNVKFKTRTEEGEVERQRLVQQIDLQKANVSCVSKDLQDEKTKCSNTARQLEEMWARELLQPEVVRALQAVERIVGTTSTLSLPEEVDPPASSSSIRRKPPDDACFPDPKRRKFY
jgi:hypothetical protein